MALIVACLRHIAGETVAFLNLYIFGICTAYEITPETQLSLEWPIALSRNLLSLLLCDGEGRVGSEGIR